MKFSKKLFLLLFSFTLVFNNVIISSEVAFADLTSAADSITIGANGIIREFVTGSNGTTYFIGDFTEVGTKTGYGVPIVTATAAKLSGFSQVNNNINIVIPDGSSGWYIGGTFTLVGATSISMVAHISSTGTLDTAFDPVLAGGTQGVKDLVLIGTTLYVGGDFNTVNGTSRKKIAAINTTNGDLVSAFDASLGEFDMVSSLAKSADDGTLYIGGSFSTIGGQSRNNIAALSPGTGLATAWNPNSNGSVTELEVSGTTVYTGGTFTTIGGQSRTSLAAVGSDGNATAWNPNPNGTVSVIQLSGTTIYVGGMYSSIGGQSRNNVAALNNTDGNAAAWNPNTDMTVSDIQISGSTIYLGGSFTTVGGTSRPGLALVDNTSGTLDLNFNASAPAYVNSFAISGSNIYVGGTFTLFGSDKYTRNHVAAVDSTGALTSWDPNPGSSSTIKAIAISGSTIYIGGSFSSIGGGSQNNLAAINSSGTLVAGWNPNPSQTVTEIVISGTTMFLAVNNMAHTIGGQVREHYSAVSTSTGTPTSWNPAGTIMGGSDDFMCVSGDILYVGGNIETIDGQPRKKLAAWTISTGAITSWNPGNEAFATINQIACDSSTIYIGGSFANIGGSARNNIAAVDTSGTATSWNPNAGSLVRAITVTSDKIYIGGDFTQVGGATTRNYLAEYNKSTGALTSWNPNMSDAVYGLYYNSSNILFAGGGFISVGTSLSPRIARWSSPTIAFTSATASGAESSTSVNIEVSLSASQASDATVNYAVTGGTATGSGTDYTLASGTATVTAGSTTTNIPLTIVNDTLDEADQTIIVTASSPSSNVVLGTNTTHTYTITDDDATPTVGFTSASSSGSESVTPASLPISLSAASGLAVTVDYAVTGGSAASGSDYTLASGTATIAAGSTSATASMTIIDDSVVESDETVIITLTGPTNSTLATATYTYTISNDDNSGGGIVLLTSGGKSSSSKTTSSTTDTASTNTTNTDEDDKEDEDEEEEGDDDDEDGEQGIEVPEDYYPVPETVVEPGETAPPENTERAQAETRALRKAASATTNYIVEKVTEVIVPETPAEVTTTPEILTALDEFEITEDLTKDLEKTDAEGISMETEATLDQVLAGEAAETLDMAKIELSVGEKIGNEVQKALSEVIIPVTDVDSPGTDTAKKALQVKIGNKTQEIDESTKFKFSFSYEDSKVLRKGYEGDNIVVVDPGTDMDGDGLADIKQITDKIPMFSPDPDGDGIKGVDEIFFDGNPTKADSFEELVPVTPRITNMGKNATQVGVDPVLWVAGEIGDKFTVHIVDAKTKSKVIKVSEGEIGNNFKAAVNVNLRDGEWYIFVKDEDGIGKISKIKVNSKLELQAPTLEKLGKDSAYRKKFIAYAVGPTEDGALISGFTEKGATIYLTWESTIFNSVVVADASSGYFEVYAPPKLFDGKQHKALAYVVDEKNKWTSSVSSLIFNRISGT